MAAGILRLPTVSDLQHDAVTFKFAWPGLFSCRHFGSYSLRLLSSLVLCEWPDCQRHRPISKKPGSDLACLVEEPVSEYRSTEAIMRPAQALRPMPMSAEPQRPRSESSQYLNWPAGGCKVCSVVTLVVASAHQRQCLRPQGPGHRRSCH